MNLTVRERMTYAGGWPIASRSVQVIGSAAPPSLQLRLGGRFGLKSAERLQRVEQLFGIGRFSQDMRRTRMAADLPLKSIFGSFAEMASAEHDEGDVLGRVGASQPRQQRLGVAVRHEVVGNDHGRLLAAGLAKALHRVDGTDRLDAASLEPADEKMPDVGVVVDQQHARALSHF